MMVNKPALKGRFENEYVDALKEFYQSYLLAVAYADDIDRTFRHPWQNVEANSLCSLLKEYCIAHNHDDLLVGEVQSELFYFSELNLTTPFNDSLTVYFEEAAQYKFHTNAKRITFVQYWAANLDDIKSGDEND